MERSSIKIVLYIIIILLFISIMKDLSLGNATQQTDQNINNNEFEPVIQTHAFQIAKVQVQPGDTFISIIDRLNEDLHTIYMEQIIEDFKKINPFVDPYALQPFAYYYFPIYNNQ